MQGHSFSLHQKRANTWCRADVTDQILQSEVTIDLSRVSLLVASRVKHT